MIIAFSGKKQSGKDTAGIITQTLLAYPKADNETIKKYLKDPMDNPDWKIKKFASYLKQVTADLTGCTVADLEIEEKKNEVVFTKYRFEDKFLSIVNEFEDINEGLEIYSNVVTSYLNTGDKSIDDISENIIYEEVGITRRNVLERLGDDVARTIHSSIWINHLFNDYKISDVGHIKVKKKLPFVSPSAYFPKWIITDTRYPNEAQAILDRGGIIIRLNRYPSHIMYSRGPDHTEKVPFDSNNISHIKLWKGIIARSHKSETALDDYREFNYIIDNNGTISELINNIRKILTDNKLI